MFIYESKESVPESDWSSQHKNDKSDADAMKSDTGAAHPKTLSDASKQRKQQHKSRNH